MTVSSPHTTKSARQPIALLDLPPEILYTILQNVIIHPIPRWKEIEDLPAVCTTFSSIFDVVIQEYPICVESATRLINKFPHRRLHHSYLVCKQKQSFSLCMQLLQLMQSCRTLEITWSINLENSSFCFRSTLAEIWDLPTLGSSLQIVDIWESAMPFPTSLWDWLFDRLRKLPKLRHLYIKSCGIMTEALPFQSSLRTLFLSKLRFCSWSQVLEPSFHSLVDLCIKEHSFRPIEDLHAVLKNCLNIERLDLSFLRYRSAPPFRRLKYLRLSSESNMECVPLEQILPHLQASRSLKVLSLSRLRTLDTSSINPAELSLDQIDLPYNENIQQLLESSVGTQARLQSLYFYEPEAFHGEPTDKFYVCCWDTISCWRSSLKVLELGFYNIDLDAIRVVSECPLLSFLHSGDMDVSALDWLIDQKLALPLRYLLAPRIERDQVRRLISNGVLPHLSGLRRLYDEEEDETWKEWTERYQFELLLHNDDAIVWKWKMQVYEPCLIGLSTEHGLSRTEYWL
ncbi:hypothetical protein BT69DRAFT_1348828 [Atractiella rhizophila]|nr:hypothetical protein BT69DRAFT_1348828 [Atractiella rhizophila]